MVRCPWVCSFVSYLLICCFLEGFCQFGSSKNLEDSKPPPKKKTAHPMSEGFGLRKWFMGSAVLDFFDFSRCLACLEITKTSRNPQKNKEHSSGASLKVDHQTPYLKNCKSMQKNIPFLEPACLHPQFVPLLNIFATWLRMVGKWLTTDGSSSHPKTDIFVGPT